MTPETVNSLARQDIAVLAARFEACQSRADERWDDLQNRVAAVQNKVQELDHNLREELKNMANARLDLWTKLFLGFLALAGSVLTALVTHYLG